MKFFEESLKFMTEIFLSKKFIVLAICSLIGLSVGRYCLMLSAQDFAISSDNGFITIALVAVCTLLFNYFTSGKLPHPQGYSAGDNFITTVVITYLAVIALVFVPCFAEPISGASIISGKAMLFLVWTIAVTYIASSLIIKDLKKH